MSRYLQPALHYHALGWCVIPIKHKSDKGKEPAIRSWTPFQKQRPNEAQVKKWFKRDDLDGVAVVLGDVSGGLICRDFDRMDAYERWAQLQPELARTLPTVATGRPGRHVYFTGKGGKILTLGDGELRQSGYTLLPTSKHPSGQTYNWLTGTPNGAPPKIDPFAVGLAGPRVTEQAEQTEDNKAYPKAICELSPAVRLEIEQAIRETLPTTTGQRNRCAFKLAQWLKGISSLADAPVAALRPIVQRWHKLALPIISTKPFEDTWFDFVYAWERVRYPRGQEPMMQLFEKAVSTAPPAIAEQYDRVQMKSLVALCRELQRAAGRGPFYLSCRTAARLLAVDAMTAWRWLFVLEADGVLQTVEKGTRGVNGKASRFRYVARES